MKQLSQEVLNYYHSLVQQVRAKNGLAPLPNIVPVDEGDIPALIRHMEEELGL